MKKLGTYPTVYLLWDKIRILTDAGGEYPPTVICTQRLKRNLSYALHRWYRLESINIKQKRTPIISTQRLKRNYRLLCSDNKIKD